MNRTSRRADNPFSRATLSRPHGYGPPGRPAGAPGCPASAAPPPAPLGDRLRQGSAPPELHTSFGKLGQPTIRGGRRQINLRDHGLRLPDGDGRRGREAPPAATRPTTPVSMSVRHLLASHHASPGYSLRRVAAATARLHALHRAVHRSGTGTSVFGTSCPLAGGRVWLAGRFGAAATARGGPDLAPRRPDPRHWPVGRSQAAPPGDRAGGGARRDAGPRAGP